MHAEARWGVGSCEVGPPDVNSGNPTNSDPGATYSYSLSHLSGFLH